MRLPRSLHSLAMTEGWNEIATSVNPSYFLTDDGLAMTDYWVKFTTH
ncbi:hypothetical protein KAX35_01740 [candidate division WOR-3 bacterium]|nr:hypothetical protein [candidate division WOR-3 bacterium]